VAIAVRTTSRPGLATRLQEGWYRATGRAELAEVVAAERATVEHLQETLADLELRMYEPGWQMLVAGGRDEFSRAGLTRITAVCRLMALKNPLIKRGIALRIAYVWGQGLTVAARGNGKTVKGRAGQDVNAVVQAFLDDDSNQRTFTSHQAQEELERALGTDGNVFLALFTSPSTGRVQVRVLPWDEIHDVVTNPQDRSEPWFYCRRWVEYDMTGQAVAENVAYYPALSYRPTGARPMRVRDINGLEGPVMWDAPVEHVKVGGLSGWKFGVPDAYAAIDWAQAYKEFLTDWARLVKALSRFAWRLTAKGQKQAAAKTKMAAGPSANTLTAEANYAGATAMLAPDVTMEAIPKTGATIDSASGRPLALMVASAFDVPITQLLSDPGQSGARATAETLDNPTELAMESRRMLWTAVYQRILAYVIDQAVKAPTGPLKGTVKRDADGIERVTLAGDTDRTVDVSWPDLKDNNPLTLIQAIVAADQTGTVPHIVVARLLLQALGVEDVDEILAGLTDEQGNFVPPDVTAGQAAIDAFRQGQDPAAVLSGRPPQDAGAAQADASQGSATQGT
jgi:hypothetical protein